MALATNDVLTFNEYLWMSSQMCRDFNLEQGHHSSIYTSLKVLLLLPELVQDLRLLAGHEITLQIPALLPQSLHKYAFMSFYRAKKEFHD